MEASAEKYIEPFEKCSVRIPGQPELRVQAVSDESVEGLQWCRSVIDVREAPWAQSFCSENAERERVWPHSHGSKID
jgi:hypothetical protein